MGSFDTKRPLNINDSGLTEDTLLPPISRDGFTEMTVMLMACDVCTAISALQPQPGGKATATAEGPRSMSFAEKEATMQQFSKDFENNYIQYCGDHKDPRAFLATVLGQLIVDKMTLISYIPLKHSGFQIPKETSEKIFLTAIKIVEGRRYIETEKTRAWHWFIRTVEQWHAVAFPLGELCERAPDDNVTHAWAVLDKVFQDWRDSNRVGAPKMLAASMKRLIAKVRRKRELDLANTRKVEETKPQLATDHFAGYQQPSDDDDDSGPQGELCFVDPLQSASRHPRQESSLYPEEWSQQQQRFTKGTTPTPWLLEEFALGELGFDMNALDGEMEWEGLDDLVQGFQTEKGAGVSEWGAT